MLRELSLVVGDDPLLDLFGLLPCARAHVLVTWCMFIYDQRGIMEVVLAWLAVNYDKVAVVQFYDLSPGNVLCKKIEFLADTLGVMINKIGPLQKLIAKIAPQT